MDFGGQEAANALHNRLNDPEAPARSPVRSPPPEGAFPPLPANPPPPPPTPGSERSTPERSSVDRMIEMLLQERPQLNARILSGSRLLIKYNNTRDVYLYIYSVSAYMG